MYAIKEDTITTMTTTTVPVIATDGNRTLLSGNNIPATAIIIDKSAETTSIDKQLHIKSQTTIGALVRGLHAAGNRDIATLNLPLVFAEDASNHPPATSSPSSSLLVVEKKTEKIRNISLPRLTVNLMPPAENGNINNNGQCNTRRLSCSNLSSAEELSTSPGRKFSTFSFAPLRRFSHAYIHGSVYH